MADLEAGAAQHAKPTPPVASATKATGTRLEDAFDEERNDILATFLLRTHLKYLSLLIKAECVEIKRSGLAIQRSDRVIPEGLEEKMFEERHSIRLYFKTIHDVTNQYCDTLRNLEYMAEKTGKGYHRGSWVRTLQRMQTRLGISWSWFGAEGESGIPHYDIALEGKEGIDGRRAKMAILRQRLINLVCGVLGGLALTVPMIIMTLAASIVSVLVTASAFVLAFGVTVALLSGLKPQEVLAVTAAYAAVLVVFVGNNNTN